jgi:RHS repeat-associated protein
VEGVFRLVERREVNESDEDDKHITAFAYDSLALVEREDPESNTTTWTHDGLARRLEESNTLGSSAYKKRTWGYDKNDRMTSHKDDANNETTWAWDARDLVTTVTYPDTGTKVFEYDDADNVTEWTDPMGTVVTLTYDDNNRNTVRAIARGTGVGGTQDEDYTYDALDRLTEGQDDDVTVQITWDSLSRKKTEKSGPNPISSYGKTTSYTYDEGGNTTRIDYPDGSFYITRTYDDANRLTKVEDASSNDIVAVQFDSMTARLQKYTFENGTTSNYLFDGFGRVSDLDHKTSAPATFAGYDMLYDKMGNLLYEEWSHDSGKGNNYAYDKAYRLTKSLHLCADPSAELASPGSQTYGTKVEYNLTDDSDRSSVVTTPYGLSAATVNYSSNNVHEYTVIGGVSRTYDNAGNLIDDGTFEYAYDYRNQLLTVTRKSNNHVEGLYEYDVFGRRTKKTLYDTTSVRYYHDGVHEIEEHDGSGNVLRKYVYREDIDSISMMEARDVADVDNDDNTTELVRLYYHFDSRSNVARLTAASQAVVESYEYDPYGIISIKDKSGSGVSDTQVGNPFDFQRRRRDGEAGLMYFRARMYHPTSGHWLQRDPLGFVPGANWHEFESSNAPSRLDPFGLTASKDPYADCYKEPSEDECKRCCKAVELSEHARIDREEDMAIFRAVLEWLRDSDNRDILYDLGLNYGLEDPYSSAIVAKLFMAAGAKPEGWSTLIRVGNAAAGEAAAGAAFDNRTQALVHIAYYVDKSLNVTIRALRDQYAKQHQENAKAGAACKDKCVRVFLRPRRWYLLWIATIGPSQPGLGADCLGCQGAAGPVRAVLGPGGSSDRWEGGACQGRPQVNRMGGL